MFPYANLISEPIGAAVCTLITYAALSFRVGGLSLKPAVAAFLSTLASGLTFVAVTILVLSLPLATLYVMLPVVLTVSVVNTILVQLIYFPAHKLFSRRGDA